MYGSGRELPRSVRRSQFSSRQRGAFGRAGGDAGPPLSGGHMISNRWLTLALVAAAFALTAAPATAQYMYLDANGNGVHDSSDRLNANGIATTVDVWLDTNHN